MKCILPIYRSILCIFILFTLPAVSQEKTTIESRPPISVNQWREDIKFLVKTIERTHPNPYKKISREEFQSVVKRLDLEIPILSPEKIIVRMMQVTALLKDGHTSLLPSDPNGFNNWYPIRFYWFEDGIY
ncbi:MAG: hypothetical protein HKN25_13035, partial [Pyrinomonadaceae bacterium]|nr:hypothetical protein [Pyrinomonadaceae bacterium]